jgi:hypothetical protein
MRQNSGFQRCAQATSPHRRAGTGALDLLVSFTLLVTAMCLAVPLIVQHGRVLKSQRNYRLALDEVANQLEHLTSQSPDAMPAAIQGLAPSDFVRQRLRAAKLSAELQPAESGSCIVLKLTWREANQQSTAVTLVGWAVPGAARSDPVEGNTP